MPLTIGVPKEVFAGEKRVATVPDVVEKLIKLGFKVAVQSGAGAEAYFSDKTYVAVGAEIVEDAAKLWSSSDIVFKVRPPTSEEVAMLREGATLIGFIWPAQHPELMEQLAQELSPFDNIEWDRQPDGFASLARAQLMVSDISGVIFDFAFVFLRPVVSVGAGPLKDGFEAWEIPHEAWEMSALDALGKRILPGDEKTVSLIPIGGTACTYGFNDLVDGWSGNQHPKAIKVAHAISIGFKNKSE